MTPTLAALSRTLAALSFAALAMAARSALAAAPACEHDTAVTIEVASELGDEADDTAMRTYLTERLPERLDGLGLCIDPQAQRHVLATVAWSNAARGDYAIALRAFGAGGEPFEPSAVDCPGCATVEVLDTIAQQVPVALAGLSDPEAHPAPAHHAPAPRGITEVSPAPERSPASGVDGARLHRLGRAGIGVAATGIAGIVTGAALWAQHSVVHPADSSYRLALRPAGITLVAAGVLATAAGATMIGIDVHARQRRRVTLAPDLGRTRAGVMLSGSF